MTRCSESSEAVAWWQMKVLTVPGAHGEARLPNSPGESSFGRYRCWGFKGNPHLQGVIKSLCSMARVIDVGSLQVNWA